MPVDLTVNGHVVSVAVVNEETPLLSVLRNNLGLMGTRFGCGLEQCGCCMVGNAVSHALGVRIRDLPLTRERIMSTLIAD